MDEKKPPHKQMTDKNNGLSSTQEVIYPGDYKEADEAYQDEAQETNEKND
ncbi:YfhE family protein [Alteribacillus bidgolensis]|uniref:YfhE-like protein n=1 Tax=Alteribacillus bidgolensis TaxID=930129 RepID=A0A1G8QIG5_9BACI|nr:YfhE family protein [Alteribacillus bidgolensis]SDJ04185.1 YfhE-like protein [Alteribacillus bidgolensis]